MNAPLTFTSNGFRYARRKTREVRVGGVGIGGSNPIRVQSMLTSDTLDTGACIVETLELVEAGCEIVRITAQTVRHAASLEAYRDGLRARGCGVPIVADIHFKPEAALEAAKWVDKVRINPGNYADSKKFAVLEYTDAEYAAEIERIRERFAPLVEACKAGGVAMRIGTNHGSLSDRIMNRFGDSPLGMVESALEFARIARELEYHEFIFSMKASNPKVAIEAYRLLASRLTAEGPDWNYPLHLGVTEAGDGEDGRIKSAIGIGSLLADGIGDTVRVSLTEDSVHEIPVAQTLARPYDESRRQGEESAPAGPARPLPFDPFDYQRRKTEAISLAGIDGPLPLGGEETIRVFISRQQHESLGSAPAGLGELQPECVLEDGGVHEIDPRDDEAVAAVNTLPDARPVTVADGCPLPPIPAFRLLALKLDKRHPIVLKDTLEAPAAGSGSDPLKALLTAGTHIGSLLCDGIGDAVLVRGETDAARALRLAYNVLQAAGSRIFKTDYVACPSCGRTLFNLQETTARIRAATEHLKGVRIAVMGCIVNGPGEMADADFGYVGGAPGKINLYVGKTPVKFNIPSAEAVDRLVDLIKGHGKWVDPA